VASIPDDIKEGLKNLGSSLKIDPKKLVEQLKTIISEDDTIKNMPPEQNEFRIRYAWGLLCRRYTATGTTVDMYIQPFCIPRARLVTIKGEKKYVGDIYAKIKRIEHDEAGNEILGDVEHAAGTLWEKAAESATKLSPKKVYKTSLKATSKSANIGGMTWEGIELGGNDAIFVEADGVEFPTNQAYYDSDIKALEKDMTISLGERDLNNGENCIDIRIIKAMVIDVGVGETAAGGEYGRYTITDNSLLGGGKDGKPGSESIWVHPDEVLYEKGSLLIFVGVSSYDATKEQYRWNSHFVLPTSISQPRIIEVKPVDKESVDVDDLLGEEHKKVEDNLDGDFAI